MSLMCNKKLKRKNCLSNNLRGISQTNSKRKIKHTIYKNFNKEYNVTLERQDFLRLRHLKGVTFQ